MARRDPDEWGWTIEASLKKLSEEMLSQSPSVVRRRAWEPRVDVFEDRANLIVKAEIAGVKGEEIQLTYCQETHSLLIRGVRHEESVCEQGVGCHLLEVYYGEFEREVVLPNVRVEPTAIRANYRNGFLIVVVPKAVAVVTEEE